MLKRLLQDRTAFKLLIIMIVALVLGGVFLKDYLQRPKISGAQDLQELKGTVSNWWQVDLGKGLDWTFELNEYKANFKIDGKFYDFAYSSRFSGEIKEGDPLYLRIPKRDIPRLNDSEAVIFPVGVWDDEYEYVEKDKAIAREMKPTDLHMALYSFGAAALVGIIIWLMQRRKN